MFRKSLCALALAGVFVTGAAQARNQIRIVGSSTIFPFANAVADQFANTTKFSRPIIESTGSVGGLMLFCSGDGVEQPDITNASRRIKKSEVEACASNGVRAITEVKIGYDGIVIANSKRGARFRLTLRDIFLALAKTVPAGEGKTRLNPYKTWNEIDPRLPAEKIVVYGPPLTSGTRDSLDHLGLEGGCRTFAWIRALQTKDSSAYTDLCRTVREDGAYINAGENDNLIVKKLEKNPEVLGIFGYSYLEQSHGAIQGSFVNGVAPNFQSISSGTYPLSRPLFFYVKKSHVGKVPGIAEYVAAFTAEKAWGANGYLAKIGLIPMPLSERKKYEKDARNLTDLSR